MTTSQKATPNWADPEQAARLCRANWQHFESFAWHDQPEDAENWALFPINSRDAGLLERSNYEVIKEEMGGFEDAHIETFNHWACGWTENLAIRVFKVDGITPTPAFKTWCEIQENLDDYPVLDDEKYSQMEYEATLENIGEVIYSVNRRTLGFDITPNLSSKVYECLSLSKEYEKELYSQDDRGGYPSEESVLWALRDLGVFKEDEVGTDDLKTDANRMTFWQWGRIVVLTTFERWDEDVQAYFDGEKFEPRVWEEQPCGAFRELDLETGDYAEDDE